AGREADYSLEVAHEIDEEVRKLIETAHTEAYEVLSTYRDVLDDLVMELLEKETLHRRDLERIFAKVEKRPRITVFNEFGKRKPSDKPPIKTPAELPAERGEPGPPPQQQPEQAGEPRPQEEPATQRVVTAPPEEQPANVPGTNGGGNSDNPYAYRPAGGSRSNGGAPPNYGAQIGRASCREREYSG